MFVLLQQECLLDTYLGGAVYFVSPLDLKLRYTSLAVVHILLLFTALHCLPLVRQVPLGPIVTLKNKIAWQDNVWLLSPWHNWYEGCALRRSLVLPKYWWLARKCWKGNELFVLHHINLPLSSWSRNLLSLVYNYMLVLLCCSISNSHFNWLSLHCNYMLLLLCCSICNSHFNWLSHCGHVIFFLSPTTTC